MRPRRSSSFICPGSAAPRQGAVTLAIGAATRHALARREAHAPAASKSTPQVLPSDLPTWAAATAAADRRVSSRAKGGIVFPDPDCGNANADDAPLVDGIRSLNKRRAATIRSSRLEPLLTVAQAATILSVSERTVRRLIASGTIRGIWIGSVGAS
jgi:excisionase family DNA binding protein